jgi:hypothetical protein
MINLIPSEMATYHLSTSPQGERREWDPLASAREIPNVICFYGDPAQMLLRTGLLAKDDIQGTPGPAPLSPDFVPPPAPSVAPVQRPSFVAQQEWEGYVSQIQEDKFVARLIDLTAAPASPDEEAEFSITELSDDDLPLVKPGAIFRWSVGIETKPGGSKQSVSRIVFRRLPQWTKRGLETADKLAGELINWLGNVSQSEKDAKRTAG